MANVVERIVVPSKEPSETGQPSESQYVAAAETIRQAARWLVAAFAAVGGVLVAGVPLTDVGRVESGSSDFWFAVLGVAAALTAIAYMIYAVSQVFTAEFISFAGTRVRQFQASGAAGSGAARADENSYSR